MNGNFLNMLGLAKRAGKVSTGDIKCTQAIRTGTAKLVITACDAGDSTKREFKTMCERCGVRYVVAGTKETIGKYTGAYERAVAIIHDENFAKAILDRLD